MGRRERSRASARELSRRTAESRPACRTRVVCLVHHEAEYDNRIFNEVVSLRDAGYDVELCAVEKREPRELPNERGIPIHRVRLSSRNWPVPKIFQTIEFSIRVLFHYVRQHVDVVHCHDLPTLPVGVVTSVLRRRRASVVYDAHEYETDRNGLSGLPQAFAKAVERLLIPHADGVMTVSDRIGREYAQLYAIPEPTVVLNCPPQRPSPGSFDLFRQELAIRPDQVIFLYQGLIEPGRGTEILLSTFQSLPTDRCVVVFMGWGSQEPDVRAAAASSPKVFFREPVPAPRFLDYTASADFGISFIEDVSLSDRYCLPNKLFEYLSAGVPVVCSSLPEMRRFVETHGVGVAAPENSPAGFAAAVQTVLGLDRRQLTANAVAASEKYNWETQAKAMLGLYATLQRPGTTRANEPGEAG